MGASKAQLRAQDARFRQLDRNPAVGGLRNRLERPRFESRSRKAGPYLGGGYRLVSDSVRVSNSAGREGETISQNGGFYSEEKELHKPVLSSA